MRLFNRFALPGRFVLALGAVLLSSIFTPAEAGQAYLILDAKTGTVLASDNADVLNHPASLTKMMTLYLTFEAIERGKLSWNTKIVMTRNAARKPPTKLGVRAGKTITVREAVDAMIVKSANDAAAAMADKLGGSEADFARMMTAKARRLGMSRTVFYNASGLPDARQVTTARDMSTLGIALQRDFPSEYKLFSKSRFAFRGRTIPGHNNLMYRYKGMDGIKTGYTNASGFNLVSSVRHGDKRLVGVVLGGRTARSRDAHMAALLTKYMGKATPVRSGMLVASGPTKRVSRSLVADAEIPTPRRAPQRSGEVEVASVETDLTVRDVITQQEALAVASTAPTGEWVVQLAATDSQASAMALLDAARGKAAGALPSLTPYTEVVRKGSSTLYRARFVDFGSRDEADAACRIFKRQSFSCLVLRGS